MKSRLHPKLIAKMVEDFRKVKNDPEQIKRFDLDGDGKLDLEEWESLRDRIREKALKEAGERPEEEMDTDKKLQLFTAYAKLENLHSTLEERKDHFGTPPQYRFGLSEEARRHQLEIDAVSEAKYRKSRTGKMIIVLTLVVLTLSLFFLAVL